MSAYGALVSLKNTLINIYISDRHRLSPDQTYQNSTRRIISELYVKLELWETILQRLDDSSKSKSRKKVNALDGRIKDTIRNFEDLLEYSLLSLQITLQSGDGEGDGDVSLISIDLQSLQGDVDSFIQTLDNVEEEYIYEVDNMPEDEDEDEPFISSSSTSAAAAAAAADTFGETKSKMIGLSDYFERFKGWLLASDDWNNIACFGLVGMGGLGKTTLARKIYEDPEILSYFNFRRWITLGRKSYSRLNQDLRTMLAELKGDEKCLIVLDDAWKTQELPSLLTSFEQMKNTIIRVLITTREQNVIEYVRETSRHIAGHLLLRFLNEDESKELLCHKVFGENSICPPQLVKAATKIAKKCEGLPLMIVTVADLLSKAQNTDLKYWEDVAEERNSVFKDAYEEISKVLYPSYDYLPQRFKMPFLYLGVFPRDYEIPLSKITNMLTAEGWFFHFLEDVKHEYSVEECLKSLCDFHNLVLFKPKSTHWYTYYKSLGIIKSCRLHSSWRYLCREEARKNNFYHVLNRLVDASGEDIKGQRCLCLENNLLFGITEFCNSVRLHSASFTRSLLFFGPYHQYPTSIDAIGFKLLRELDALQLRFYSFPTQVLALVLLKYLALTCNGQLPPTISKLFNLKTLIIHPHTSITKCCDTNTHTSSSTPSSYIPIEIWDMIELEHIEILGKSLPPPPNDANSLKNVKTLLGVNAASICNISELFKRFRKIKKLAVQMVLTPYDVVDHDLIFRCFANISTLERLKTLKCSIINPVLVEHGQYIAPSSSSSSSPRPLMLPRGLKKLHLSGMGFLWEYMDVIGNLQRLKVLKLRCYAFRGSKWETEKNSFRRLRYLVIEDSDLVQWKPASGSFLKLRYLSLKHCYKLHEFHWPSDATNAKIELVDCNPLAVTCAKKFHREDEDAFFLVSVTDSFEA